MLTRGGRVGEVVRHKLRGGQGVLVRFGAREGGTGGGRRRACFLSAPIPKQIIENAGDVCLVPGQSLLEGLNFSLFLRIPKTHFPGEHCEPARAGGDLVRLKPVGDLDAVLNIAEEDIGGGQVAAVRHGQKTQAFDARERLKGIEVPKEGFLPPVDQLEGLDDEFDLPDPSLAELYVRNAAPAGGEISVDPLLDAGDLIEGAHVEGAPVDEGLNQVDEGAAQRDRSGRGPGLDERLPLPRLSPRLVIDPAARKRVGEGALPPLGPQAGVHPENVAFLGVLGHQRDQPLRQPGVELIVRDAVLAASPGPRDPRRSTLVRGIDEEQVNVRADVQLLAAMFSQCDDGELARSVTPVLSPEARLSVERHDAGAGDAETGLQADVRQIGQGAGGFMHFGQSQQIPEADAEILALTIPAEGVRRPPRAHPPPGAPT